MRRNKLSRCSKDVIVLSLALCWEWESRGGYPWDHKLFKAFLHDNFLCFESVSSCWRVVDRKLPISKPPVRKYANDHILKFWHAIRQNKKCNFQTNYRGVPSRFLVLWDRLNILDELFSICSAVSETDLFVEVCVPLPRLLADIEVLTVFPACAWNCADERRIFEGSVGAEITERR